MKCLRVFFCERKINVIFFVQQVIQLLSGDSEDHAVLLTCYFLHLGRKVWLLLGAGIPDGPSAYVLTHETGLSGENGPREDYWIWDPVSGQHYSVQDNFCPLQKVWCLMNEENVSFIYPRLSLNTFCNLFCFTKLSTIASL